MAEALLEEVMKKIKVQNYRVLEKFRDQAMERLKCRHPFLIEIPCSSLLPISPWMLERGVSIPLLAWQEDYESGIQYGLDIYSPVDDDGRFTADVPFFAGNSSSAPMRR